MNFDYAYTIENNTFTVWNTSVDDLEKKYLPPELSKRKNNLNIGSHSDLYSLGVMFYELLCNSIPYEIPEDLELKGGIISQDLLPSYLNNEIPNWVDKIIKKLYSSEINSRYKSVYELLEEIDTASNIINDSEVKNSYKKFKPSQKIDNFEIIEYLGGGTFSDVYLAQNQIDDNKVALKVYKKDQEFILSEAKLLRKLNHKNIVKYIWSDRFRDYSNYYLAVEYLDGKTIDQLKIKDENEIINITLDILEALEYLHNKIDLKEKLYHRDIKPENIIFVENRGAVLIDFNISKDALSSNTFLGTPPYIAPDLVNNGIVSWNDSCDTFALGITIYKLLCNEHPYPNESPSLLQKPCHPKDKMKNHIFSDEFYNFVYKAIQPLAKDRFLSVLEMKKSLLAIENKDILNNKIETIDLSSKKDLNFIENEEIHFYCINEVLKLEIKVYGELLTVNNFDTLSKKNEDSFLILFLSDLIDNGKLFFQENLFSIKYENLYAIDRDWLDILNLPTYYYDYIQIITFKETKNSGIELSYKFIDSDKNKYTYERNHCFLEENDTIIFLLSKEQYDLCEKIDLFNNTNTTDNSKRSFLLEEIKSLSVETASYFDQSFFEIIEKKEIIQSFSYEDISLLPYQEKVIELLEKYISFSHKIILLSGSEKSERDYIVEYIINKRKIKIIEHDNSNSHINDFLLDSLEKSDLIIIKDGGTSKDWFSNLRLELQIRKINIAIISTQVSFLQDIPIVNIDKIKNDFLDDEIINKVLIEKEEFKINHIFKYYYLSDFEFKKYKIEQLILNKMKDDIQINENKLSKSIETISNIIQHPFLLDKKLKTVNADLVSNSNRVKLLIDLLHEIKEKNEKVCILANEDLHIILTKVISNEFNFIPTTINLKTKTTYFENKTQQEKINSFCNNNSFNVIIISMGNLAKFNLNSTKIENIILYSRDITNFNEKEILNSYINNENRNINVYTLVSTIENEKSFDQCINEFIDKNIEEIIYKDIFDPIFSDYIKIPVELENLSIKEADIFNPFLFEALIGTIFNKKGFKTILTPKVGDKGADVIAFSDEVNYLIQVKQSKSNIGDSSIGEILKSKGYYENYYKNARFDLLIVTNQNLNYNAKNIAKNSTFPINFIERDKLNEIMNEFVISIKDVLDFSNNEFI